MLCACDVLFVSVVVSVVVYLESICLLFLLSSMLG